MLANSTPKKLGAICICRVAASSFRVRTRLSLSIHGSFEKNLRVNVSRYRTVLELARDCQKCLLLVVAPASSCKVYPNQPEPRAVYRSFRIPRIPVAVHCALGASAQREMHKRPSHGCPSLKQTWARVATDHYPHSSQRGAGGKLTSLFYVSCMHASARNTVLSGGKGSVSRAHNALRNAKDSWSLVRNSD